MKCVHGMAVLLVAVIFCGGVVTPAHAWQWRVVTLNPAHPESMRRAEMERRAGVPARWRLRIAGGASHPAIEQQWEEPVLHDTLVPWVRLRRTGWPVVGREPARYTVEVSDEIRVPVQWIAESSSADDAGTTCAGVRYLLHGTHPAGYQVAGSGRACLQGERPVWQSGWIVLTTPHTTEQVQFAWAAVSRPSAGGAP